MWVHRSKPGEQTGGHRFLGKLSNRDKAGLRAMGGGFPAARSFVGTGTRSQLLKGLHEILPTQWTPGVRGMPQYLTRLNLVVNKNAGSFVGSRALCAATPLPQDDMCVAL